MKTDASVRKEIEEAVSRAPKNLDGVFFLPWVGRQYSAGGMFGARVLLLGESHYAWEENQKETEDVTCLCIAEQVTSMEYKYRFWTGIAIAFLGDSPDLEMRRQFWNSVSFYNYVQKFVGVGARKRPSEDMWKASEAGFLSILRALQPDIVFALGKEMWPWLPHSDEPEEPVPGETIASCAYRTAGQKMAKTYLVQPHPSSGGFSGRTWHPVIKELISRSLMKRQVP